MSSTLRRTALCQKRGGTVVVTAQPWGGSGPSPAAWPGSSLLGAQCLRPPPPEASHEVASRLSSEARWRRMSSWPRSLLPPEQGDGVRPAVSLPQLQGEAGKPRLQKQGVQRTSEDTSGSGESPFYFPPCVLPKSESRRELGRGTPAQLTGTAVTRMEPQL